MKTILACLLVLAISVPLSNAQCFFQPLKLETSDSEVAGCRDMNGKLHEFDSRWRSDACYDCSCSREGIGCCASFKTPTGYNKKKCVRIFNKDTCTYKVVKKDNHSEECSVYKWVG